MQTRIPAPAEQARHHEQPEPQSAQLQADQQIGFADTRSDAAQLKAIQAMMSGSPQVQKQQAQQATMGQAIQLAGEARPNKTGLPDNLKSGVENLSGMSLDHVKVHYNSDKPAQLNAHAYAQGSDIHVAPGQEKHLPHEAWHVVQQAQGRVKPTLQMKAGVPVNDDAGLETEADVMGAKALSVGQLATATTPSVTMHSHQASSHNQVSQLDPDSDAENLISSMEAMKNMPKMQWNGSGDKGFEDWSKSEDDEHEPETANCWNAIMYAAYKANLVDKGYIQRANVGGKDPLGPELVRKIVGSPAGNFLKNKDETAESFQQRVAETKPDIPRGMVVVFHSAGFHVALSLGGGELMELDKQDLITVVNPNYNKNYVKENNAFKKQIETLTRQAKSNPAKQQDLLAKNAEYELWKQHNSRDETFSKRMDNELRQVTLTPGLNHYLLMLNLDGIYWGNLPAL